MTNEIETAPLTCPGCGGLGQVAVGGDPSAPDNGPTGSDPCGNPNCDDGRLVCEFHANRAAAGLAASGLEPLCSECLALDAALSAPVSEADVHGGQHADCSLCLSVGRLNNSPGWNIRGAGKVA